MKVDLQYNIYRLDSIQRSYSNSSHHFPLRALLISNQHIYNGSHGMLRLPVMAKQILLSPLRISRMIRFCKAGVPFWAINGKPICIPPNRAMAVLWNIITIARSGVPKDSLTWTCTSATHKFIYQNVIMETCKTPR